MKSLFKICCIVIVFVATTLQSCSSSEHNGFVGKFTDEYGNKFELRDDYTATITFANTDPIETKWSDGANHDSPYATIEYNGNAAYYFLRDGALYRHRENMIQGKLAIKITWDE